ATCVTSIAIGMARRPSALIFAAVSASRPRLREAIATSAPAPANPSAIARPMPRLAPVTNARLPARENRPLSITAELSYYASFPVNRTEKTSREDRFLVKNTSVSLKNLTCIEDLRILARRRVPKAFFDYTEAGSYAQETLHANREDFQRIKLRQRVLIDVAARTTATTLLGEPVTVPLALSAVAMTGLMHGNGEILACRAAHEAGIPYTLSTMSI